MRQILTLAAFLVGLAASAAAETSLDSNVAFYEGETMNYIIYPPNGFRMVDWDATTDGYSFAFIPHGQQYESADMMIGVNLFKIRGLDFDKVVTADTASLREHFGEEIEIWPVDSVFAATGQDILTLYVHHPSGYVPNVMLSYVNGATELLVFELVITDRVTRITAEEQFVQCLEKLKILTLGDLGMNP
jgi:hypothetical protein